MTYLVTGATGFIGRFLVPALLRRDGDIHVLIRPGDAAAERFARCAAEWDGGERVRPVVGDLAEPGPTIDPAWVDEHRGTIAHVFHLATTIDHIGNADTDPEHLAALDPAATRRVVELARALEADRLHHLSTVDVSGDHRGPFTESMLDTCQHLTPRQRGRYESERVIRASGLDWRIYRPAIVIGHSRTGEVDESDVGTGRFFELLRRAGQLPRLLPVLVPQLGETNMVPVDFVAEALDHIAHSPAPAHSTFHLTDPARVRAVDALNLFADEAGAPHLVEVMGKNTLRKVLRMPGMQRMLPSVGLPEDALEHSEFGCWFDCANTTAALAGTGITVPPLADYAPRIWKTWNELATVR
ncbi:SDR family oxidoreductase [Nocardia higoensis]|uniref:SDR family oxidoreductase n=1 Tax=Nocardia higoensis TaxID=228599 RepID=A0ABS0DC81_9NOCA|nr:SDR family oxidoreductase [Nocardia higoensis]MBF6356086.1 SDR family oxidoreductase [Nocardia higoensis]